MKFGKQIQADQVPGWSLHYLDYKSLKKIISSFEANRPPSEATALALDSPRSVPDNLTLLPPGIGQDEERGKEFQAYKAAFFFKLERELEKINAFYLEKEAELKMRLETLLLKRRAAATRVLPDSLGDYATKDHVEWNAVEEGFHLLERDLGKLQQFVEINATGFRKILKKWDKRSKSTTKELYLSRQVDVQPVFNRQLISELSDTVAACLLDLTDLTVGMKYEGTIPEDAILSHQLSIYGSPQMGPFQDLESNVRKAVAEADRSALQDLVRYSDSLSQSPDARMHVTRILWKAVIDAPPHLADLILASSSGPFNYLFVDDINGRTCLHEAARVGAFRLVNVCLENGVQREKVDVYGRSALHYAAMNGHASHGAPSLPNTNGEYPIHLAAQAGHSDVCRLLVDRDGWDTPDKYNEWTPLFHAARYGHERCLPVLLEAGSRTDRKDEPF
ncbi:hypothetical protein EW026_g446 [Hermanssonia centrifuga]|uniref:SPX domain-containing protein n=1 Tax=Hermanssonia centrifuga TaxID=98765 RepID=A0A4S4KWB7_9APHY|nr:hypothetical protein EW026_g446 [Hermanssonia centrifuga]